MADIDSSKSLVEAAYDDGRRAGLATAALALSITAFINLLGVEKSLLAIVLAVLALQGTERARTALRRGRAALAIGIVHVVIFVTALVAFHRQLAQLIHLVLKIG